MFISLATEDPVKYFSIVLAVNESSITSAFLLNILPTFRIDFSGVYCLVNNLYISIELVLIRSAGPDSECSIAL